MPALNRRDIFICVICVFVIKSTNQAKVALSRCFAGEDRKCKSSVSLVLGSASDLLSARHTRRFYITAA